MPSTIQLLVIVRRSSLDKDRNDNLTSLGRSMGPPTLLATYGGPPVADMYVRQSVVPSTHPRS